MIEGKEPNFLQLKKQENVDVVVELRDWLFALEGAQEMAERWWFSSHEDVGRVERCWHTTFHCLRVNAKGSPKDVSNGKKQLQQFPVQLITVKRQFFLLLSIFYLALFIFCIGITYFHAAVRNEGRFWGLKHWLNTCSMILIIQY